MVVLIHLPKSTTQFLAQLSGNVYNCLTHIYPAPLHTMAFVLSNYNGVLNNIDLDYMDPLVRG